jgi:hypothetical protein
MTSKAGGSNDGRPPGLDFKRGCSKCPGLFSAPESNYGKIIMAMGPAKKLSDATDSLY